MCRALDLKPHKTKGSFCNHFRKLDADEKQPTHILGRVQTLISEAGVYKLAQRSSKAEARMFDRWVRHTVLPAIRKDGGYIMGVGRGRRRQCYVAAFIHLERTLSG